MTDKRITADLAVIGGGGAGLASALRASESGVENIVVLEKRPYFGGNSGMAGGWVFAAASHLQKEAGNQATAADCFDEAVIYHHYERLNLELYWNLIQRSAFTIDWLETLGAEYTVDGPWTHRPAKLDVDFGYFRRYIDRMAQALRKRGEQIIVNAAVTQIKAEDGQVTGLIYQDATSGELVQVDTPNVILASGGFIGNDELLCQYFPNQYYPGAYLTDAIPLQGDGIALAREAGAKLQDYCTLLREPNYSFTKRNHAPNRVGGCPTAMWVNQMGRRYMREDAAGRNEKANPLIAQPGMVGYAIFDQAGLDALCHGELPFFIAFDPSSIQDYLEHESRKWVCRSDSIEEIAAWIGAKPDMLRQTLDEYNDFCDQGEDLRFGKSPEYLSALPTSPYYAVKFCPLMIDTFGPVMTDRELRVLGKDDIPIHGFYAAGVIVSGWEGREYYLSGSALGLSLACGLLAGETVAKDMEGARYADQKTM